MHPFSQFLTAAVRRCLPAAAAVALVIPALIAHGADPVTTRVSMASGFTPNGLGLDLSAEVTTAMGDPVGGGTVDFLQANGQSVGSAIVGTDGRATLMLALPPTTGAPNVSGDHVLAIVAAYHAPVATGDGTAYRDARSAVTAIATPQATSTTPNFSVTGNPTTITVAAGSYGTTVLTVTSVGSYAGSIEFSCSGLPAQTTCAFNPTQQNLTANGTFTSTLQIATQATSGPQTSMLRGGGGIAMAILLPGGLLLLAFSGGRRVRGLQVLGAVLLLSGAGMGLSGCSQRYGYLHHPPLVATGTPAGTYSITVAVDGTVGSSTIENDIPISLVVQ